jgi:hypothetical protein
MLNCKVQNLMQSDVGACTQVSRRLVDFSLKEQRGPESLLRMGALGGYTFKKQKATVTALAMLVLFGFAAQAGAAYTDTCHVFSRTYATGRCSKQYQLIYDNEIFRWDPGGYAPDGWRGWGTFDLSNLQDHAWNYDSVRVDYYEYDYNGSGGPDADLRYCPFANVNSQSFLAFWDSLGRGPALATEPFGINAWHVVHLGNPGGWSGIHDTTMFISWVSHGNNVLWAGDYGWNPQSPGPGNYQPFLEFFHH